MDKKIIKNALQQLGFSAFRKEQAVVVMNMLKDIDLLVIMPTGGGKSLCFQLPAYIDQGLTIVISPLIALMEDQVASLNARQPGMGVCLHSSLDVNIKARNYEQIKAGTAKMVYLSPELFTSDYFLSFCATAGIRISRIVIDEAHCISNWGRQFRSDFQKLGQSINALSDLQGRKIPVAAFTASANQEIRNDIVEAIQRDPALLAFNVDRPNIFYSIVPLNKKEQGIGGGIRNRLLSAKTSWPSLCQRVNELLRAYPPEQYPTLIYASTRKRVEDLSANLKMHGFDVSPYHSGLSYREKMEVQQTYIHGQTHLVVATSAFGMGVDKPDIRHVIHIDAPPSLDAYVQETGRAGRDGKPSFATMIFHPNISFQSAEYLLNASHPTGADMHRYLASIKTFFSYCTDPVSRFDTALKEVLGIKSGYQFEIVLELLVKAGALESLQLGHQVEFGPTPHLESFSPSQLPDYDQRRRDSFNAMDQVRQFASHQGCLRKFLLDHFNSLLGTRHHHDENPRCCANCQSHLAPKTATTTSAEVPLWMNMVCEKIATRLRVNEALLMKPHQREILAKKILANPGQLKVGDLELGLQLPPKAKSFIVNAFNTLKPKE